MKETEGNREILIGRKVRNLPKQQKEECLSGDAKWEGIACDLNQIFA